MVSTGQHNPRLASSLAARTPCMIMLASPAASSLLASVRQASNPVLLLHASCGHCLLHGLTLVGVSQAELGQHTASHQQAHAVASGVVGQTNLRTGGGERSP